MAFKFTMDAVETVGNIADNIGLGNFEAEEGGDLRLPVQHEEPNLTYQEIPRKNLDCPQDGQNLLGSGSFGCVYKGVYRPQGGRTKINVAVKCPNNVPRGGLMKRDEEDFLREAKVLFRFQHENVVRVYGMVLCREEPFYGIVMELVTNNSLYEYLGHSTIPIYLQVGLMMDVASALDHIHKLKPKENKTWAHNDIKAANILLTADFRAKVTDFGITKLKTIANRSSSVQQSDIRFTSSHRAPELILERAQYKPSEQTDVYSYGILMYETTKNHPYDDQTLDQDEFYNLAKAKDPAVNSSNLPTDYPAFMKELLLKCTHLEQGQRPRFNDILLEMKTETGRQGISEKIERERAAVSQVSEEPPDHFDAEPVDTPVESMMSTMSLTTSGQITSNVTKQVPTKNANILSSSAVKEQSGNDTPIMRRLTDREVLQNVYTRCRKNLVEDMTASDVLDRLLQDDVITWEECDRMRLTESHQGRSEAVRQTLSILSLRSLKGLNVLKVALRESLQEHLAELLEKCEIEERNRQIPVETVDGPAPRQANTGISSMRPPIPSTVDRPPQDPGRLLTREDMQFVGDNLGNKWRPLGRVLGFNDATLDNIKADCKGEGGQRECGYGILRMWRDCNSLEATAANLKEKLRHPNVQLKLIADKL